MMEEYSIQKKHLATFELDTILKGHTSQVTLLLLFDDNTLVSGSNDNIIKIWDLNKDECIATLKGHIGPINDIIIHFKISLCEQCSYLYFSNYFH